MVEQPLKEVSNNIPTANGRQFATIYIVHPRVSQIIVKEWVTQMELTFAWKGRIFMRVLPHEIKIRAKMEAIYVYGAIIKVRKL